MKVFVLIFLAVFFMLQACVSDSETHIKKSEKSFPKNEESGQIKNQETEIYENPNIKKGSIGPAKTVKIKVPSIPPELTPELERKREAALNQKNVPE